MRCRELSTAVLAAALLGGCRVGPDYERPAYPLPDSLRGTERVAEEALVDEAEAFGDLEWVAVFEDPVLQVLVRTALVENYDLRAAAERIVEARARLKITRSELYPDLQAVGAYQDAKATETGANPIPPGVDERTEEYSLVGDLTWEIDFWGRIASATDAARADLFATELARRAVVQSLVAEVALAYFDLLELDAELEITRRTLESRQSSYELVALRLEQGVTNRVELRQSEGLVLQTAGLVPALEQRIEEQENLIQFLIGGNPGPVPRGKPLAGQEQGLELPAGLPSELLTRRPDVRGAEEGLVAANARIGEARALLFPTLRLTAFGGVASEDLDDLFDGNSDTWSVVPSLTQPIFNAGRLRSDVRVTESQQRQAALAYMATLQQAFREVADGLAAREKTAEVRGWIEQLEEALQDQADLSRERYRGGVTSYLEVLDSERDHFDAELSLVRALRDELFAYVRLYRALGGGWQGAEELAATGAQAVPVVSTEGGGE
jgi:multidrug efflux system outer membrane protein